MTQYSRIALSLPSTHASFLGACGMSIYDNLDGLRAPSSAKTASWLSYSYAVLYAMHHCPLYNQ